MSAALDILLGLVVLGVILSIVFSPLKR